MPHDVAAKQASQHNEHAEPQGGNGDPVAALVQEVRAHGGAATHEVHERLEHLSSRAIDRFITALGGEENAQFKAVIAVAKEIKEHKDHRKELTPHLAGEQKEGLSTKGYKMPTLEHKAHEIAGGEFTHDRWQGGGRTHSVTRTGDAAKERQDRHEANEKKREDAERAKEGSLSKHLHVSVESTVAKKEWELHKGYQKGFGKFGDEHSAVSGGGQVIANNAKANAEATVGLSRDKGLTIGGNAGASYTLVGGNYVIQTRPIPFSVFGENFNTKFTFGVDASVGAEAKGKIDINVNPMGGQGGVEAGVSAFAGAQVNASAGAEVNWVKRGGAEYASAAAAHASSFLGQWLPASVVNRIPTSLMTRLLTTLLPRILGSDSGDALVVGAQATAGARAGIGAAANFEASFRGGVVHCHGKFGVTFGVGASADANVSLGLIDGMRLLGVMLVKGINALGEWLQPAKTVTQWLQEKRAEAVRAIHDWCQAQANDSENGFVIRHIMSAIAGMV